MIFDPSQSQNWETLEMHTEILHLNFGLNSFARENIYVPQKIWFQWQVVNGAGHINTWVNVASTTDSGAGHKCISRVSDGYS